MMATQTDGHPKMVTIQHERAPGYRTEYVNGVTTAGPLSDGLCRVTFFRDAFPPIAERFRVSDADPTAVDTSKREHLQVQIIREDLITLLVNANTAREMARDLAMLADSIDAAK